MDAVALQEFCRRKRLLHIIESEFDGVIPLQKHLIERMKKEHRGNTSTASDLRFFVKKGILKAEHHGADCQGITYRLAKRGG